MSEVLRTLKLDDDQYSRINAILSSEEPENIGRVLAAMLRSLALEREKAWDEVYRIASVDRDTERVQISHVTKEIIVLRKSKEDE